MPEIDPEHDLRTIKANLDKAKNYAAQALDDISFQTDMVEAVSPYWVRGKGIHPSGAALSTAGTVGLWALESQKMFEGAQAFAEHSAFASSIAANVGSSTGTLAQFEPSMQSVSVVVSCVLDRRLKREKTRQALGKIDPSLADTFATIWQYKSHPVSDPGRGPLSQMRQVFDHFLSAMAPDKEVASQPSFVPDAQLKAKDGKGITRTHRIHYLATVKVKNKSYGEAMISSSQAFLDIYNELNELHKKGKLDQAKVDRALTQGEVLLQEWLTALNLP